jgi:hypothetical protein
MLQGWYPSSILPPTGPHVADEGSPPSPGPSRYKTAYLYRANYCATACQRIDLAMMGVCSRKPSQSTQKNLRYFHGACAIKARRAWQPGYHHVRNPSASRHLFLCQMLERLRPMRTYAHMCGMHMDAAPHVIVTSALLLLSYLALPAHWSSMDANNPAS